MNHEFGITRTELETSVLDLLTVGPDTRNGAGRVPKLGLISAAPESIAQF
jgi:hypothetical protein